MKTAAFSFELDVEHLLMRVTMAGFFDADAIDRFVVARNAALRRLGSAPNQHKSLIDIRDMQIQTQDSVAAFQAVLSNPVSASKRMAFVVSKSLARLQLKRAAATRGAGYFTEIAEAERWLLDD